MRPSSNGASSTAQRPRSHCRGRSPGDRAAHRHHAKLARGRSAQRGDPILRRQPGWRCRVFPDLETLPYDSFSAHPDITSARLATLAELPRARQGVWLVAIDTLLQRLAPRSYVEAYSLKVHVGETLDLDALRAQLALAGYAAVTQVVAHGEFAVRGSLIDVFPMGSETPYRIDMLDRDVDSIRRFDPDTQRSLDKLDRIQLLPARETPLNPDAVREFRRRYRLRFTGDLSEQAVYRDVSSGIAPGGIEFFLPLFFERTSHLFEYLPPDSVLVDINDAATRARWPLERHRANAMNNCATTGTARYWIPPKFT